jgi:hypothetical protein
MERCALIVATIFVFGIVLGCSGASQMPTDPGDNPERGVLSEKSHMLWGMYEFTVNPEEKTLEYLPLRAVDMHLNVLPFLEPPPLVNLTLESLEFNGDNVEVDLGIRHPFLGLDEFTGFDVCGILISKGSVTGFSDPDLRLPGWQNLRLLNPDGYSRWWNPVEFPVNDGSMFGYNDGLLGTPYYKAKYDATLNGYKYYCDDLDDPDAPLSDVDPTGRGVFSAGKKLVRHYSIRTGSVGLTFNYAIDACWEFPEGSSPWDIPGSFPPEANRPEPWFIDVEVMSNSLWNDGDSCGGDLSLVIDVYDWYNAEMNLLTVESPGNFDSFIDMTPSGGGEGYARYNVDITSATPGPNNIHILITAASEDMGFGGNIPGVNTSAYQYMSVAVSDEYVEPLVAVGTAEIMPYFDGFGPAGTPEDPIPTEWYLALDASDSTGPINQYRWEMDGDDQYDDAFGKYASAGFPLPGTHVIKLKVLDAQDGYAIYELPGSYTVVKGTYVSCQSC